MKPAHITGSTQPRRLGLSVFVAAGIKVGSAGLTFGMFVFIAQALGADAYGTFATMFSLGSFLGFLVLMGQHTRAIKRLSAFIDAQDFGLVRGLIAQSVSTVLIISAALCLVMWALAALLDGTAYQRSADVLIGTMPFVLPFALSELLAALFRAQGSIALGLLPRDIIWRAFVIAICGAFGPALLNGASATTTMFAISAILLALILIQAALLAWRLPRATWSTKASPLPRGFWDDSKWLWAASLVNIMAGHLSVVFTSMNLTSAETGAFFAAGKIALLLQLPLVAVVLVAGPILARNYAKADMAAMQRTCRTFAPVLVGASLLGALFIFMLPGWLLSQFDPVFANATATLIVLTLAQLVTAFCGFGTLVMIMSDRERPQTLLIGSSELLGLLLIFALAPTFGLIGAAIAALIGKCIGKILASLYCVRHFGIDPSIFSLLRPAERV